MFNPEKMLGGLLRGGMRRGGGGLGSLVKGGAALGLLGVAMEAVEHYMNKPAGAAGPGMPPPIPPVGASGPPPLPGRPVAPPPPPGGVAVQAPTSAQAPTNDAVLMIRAMIAAANADGAIDADERGAILDRLKSVQLSPEEHQFIMHELLDPKPVHTIVAAAASPELARQVYLASILAITVDTDEEIDYLRHLAEQLRLDRDTLATLHQQVGMEVIF
ncbi:MAG: tellurite resistance TerB family protein [Desulfobacterales bacterium]|nr:tellurite resistance TerB family protein [Desulfobacterales bacterium]